MDSLGDGGESGLARSVERVVAERARAPAEESLLVAMSGIDASGKGYVATRLVSALRQRGLHAVAIGADGWLHLPSVRFREERPAEHFYHHAFRFDEMFERLILPLKRTRSIRLTADLVEETATAYHRHAYDHQDVDVAVLEGIFLFKRGLCGHYDLGLWVECSFETALERALARGQEGLPPEATIRAYQTIYFPAQRLHFDLDDPRSAVAATLVNDPRLASTTGNSA